VKESHSFGSSFKNIKNSHMVRYESFFMHFFDFLLKIGYYTRVSLLIYYHIMNKLQKIALATTAMALTAESSFAADGCGIFGCSNVGTPLQ